MDVLYKEVMSVLFEVAKPPGTVPVFSWIFALCAVLLMVTVRVPVSPGMKTDGDVW